MNDYTTLFMKGAILGYCQSHKPEEIAILFDDVALNLDSEHAMNIAGAIPARILFLLSNKDDANIEEYIRKIEKRGENNE